MTDTARTLSAILTLLADNSSGDISAQDVRDLAQSIANPVPAGGFDRMGEVVLYARFASLNVSVGTGSYPNLDLGSHLAGATHYVPNLCVPGDAPGKSSYVKVPLPGTYLISAWAGYDFSTGTGRYLYLDGNDSDSFSADALSPGYQTAQITGPLHFPAGATCPAFDIITEAIGATGHCIAIEVMVARIGRPV